MISARRVSISPGPNILRYTSLELLVAQFMLKGENLSGVKGNKRYKQRRAEERDKGLGDLERMALSIPKAP